MGRTCGIVVDESDIKKYYNKYKEKYKQEESRDILYVAFEVVPSEADYKDAEKWINEIKPEFEEVEDVEQYINFTSPPYDPTNYKKGELLPDTLNQIMFSANLGDVYGPYFEDNSFKLAKLAKINYLPDSVRASHILITATQANIQEMRSLADSLTNLAKEGYNFSDLVEKNSRDTKTIASGGDMGWFKEGFKGKIFSDSCFYSNVGDIKLTYAEDGFHIVKITDKSRLVKKVQVGILTREVTPSAETDQEYYSKAVAFASTNNTLDKFEKAVADNNPMAIPVPNLKPLDDNVPGIENSRNIVHWAFVEAEEGDMLKDIEEYGGKYIVAILTKVNHKGYKDIDDVEVNIREEVIKQKKAEQLSEEMKKIKENSSNIDDVAHSLELKVYSASGVRFTSFSIHDAGTEPKLIAAAAYGNPDKLNGPVAGENGVFLFAIDNVNDNQSQLGNPALLKSSIEMGYLRNASSRGSKALKELAKIKDKRYKFY